MANYNKEQQEFYKNIWGGYIIHTGIYGDLLGEEEIEVEEHNYITVDTIKQCVINKSELMWKIINSYFNNLNPIKIAEFGSGYGVNARYIYNKYLNINKSPNIDCYDLSLINCIF